jgi:hypothetical protein
MSHHDLEKEGFEAPAAKTATHSSDEEDHSHGFTQEEQRHIIRRIDRRLVVTVGAMYCVSLMDRTNLSAAAIAGMTKELKLYLDNKYVCIATSGSVSVKSPKEMLTHSARTLLRSFSS